MRTCLDGFGSLVHFAVGWWLELGEERAAGGWLEISRSSQSCSASMSGSSGFFRASRLRSHQSVYRVGHGSGESVRLIRQNWTAFYDLTLKSDSITSAHSVGYKWVRSSLSFKGRGIRAHILMSGCQVSQKTYRMSNIIRDTGFGKYNLPQSFKMHSGVCLQQLQHIFLDTDSPGVASLLLLSSLLKGLLQRTHSLRLNITKMACFTQNQSHCHIAHCTFLFIKVFSIAAGTWEGQSKYLSDWFTFQSKTETASGSTRSLSAPWNWLTAKKKREANSFFLKPLK